MVYVVKTAYTLESIVYCMYMYYLTTPSTEYTDGAPKNQKKLSPIVSKENIQSISSIWSVNLLCFFQCASTNRNILTLSSIWPVKSTRFFRLECPNRGSFWRNYVLPYGICGQNCIYTWIYCLLYVHVLSNNPFYWVYRWSPKKSEKTIPIASKENIRLVIFYLIGVHPQIKIFWHYLLYDR